MQAKRQKVPARKVLECPACFIAYGFGTGLAPIGPGTFGTLAAIPLYLLIANLPAPAYLAITLLLFLSGIWLCGHCEQILGIADPAGIVWDEIVGLLITLAFTPPSTIALAAGFLFFRLFDILKPWPINWLDRRIHGGLGIMLDDAVAGLFAGSVLYTLLHYGLLKPIH